MQKQNYFFEKIGAPLKNTNKKIKTWMGNSTGNTDKKNYENRQKR